MFIPAQLEKEELMVSCRRVVALIVLVSTALIGPWLQQGPPPVSAASTSVHGSVFRGNPARTPQYGVEHPAIHHTPLSLRAPRLLEQYQGEARQATRRSGSIASHPQQLHRFSTLASGPDQPGYTCSGAASSDDSKQGYADITTGGTRSISDGGSISGDMYNYTATADGNGEMHTQIAHSGNGNGHWIEAQISSLALASGVFDWGFDRPDANFSYNYNMYGLQWNGAQWLIHYNQNNIYAASAQPGMLAYVAAYIDCIGYPHLYLGSSWNNLTEVQESYGTLTSGVTQPYYVASSMHWTNAGATATVSDQRFYNGIPADVSISNWNEGGATVTGAAYLPSNSGPTADDSGSPSGTCTCGSNGDPINDATGTFWHTFTDFSIPGRGIPLTFSRTYRSRLASQDSPLGYGWTDSYNLFLSTAADGSVSVHEENGAVVRFPLSGSTYTPPSYIQATLADNGDGTFTFQRKNQIRYIFTAPTQTVAGRLLRAVDRNGYATVLSYNGSNQLTAVTDPSGRSLSFTYKPDNRIDTVTDPSGRQVAFTYDDATGNLTDVTDTRGGNWHFGYDGNHLLQTMRDPRGNTLTNVYDTQGRVTSQSLPATNSTHTTTLQYTANADGTTTTTITDPMGNVTVERYFQNVLLIRTQGYGTPQAAIWHYGYDPVTLGVTSVVDPSHRTSRNTWDSHRNLLTSQQPQVAGESGPRTTTTTYNSFNEPLTVQVPGGEVTTYTYDSAGNLTSVSRPVNQTGGSGTLRVLTRRHATRASTRANETPRWSSAMVAAGVKPTATPTPSPTATNTPTLTNTPTPSATSTPLPDSVQQRVVNGDFESGTAPWIGAAPVSDYSAYSPTHDAQFCGTTGCAATLTQAITLPSTFAQVTLSYWLTWDTSDPGPPGCSSPFSSEIDTMSGTRIVLADQQCVGTSQTSSSAASLLFPNPWSSVSVDLTSALSAYKGQRVQLKFTGQTGLDFPTRFGLDDVSLVASQATPTPTATATSTSTNTPTPTSTPTSTATPTATPTSTTTNTPTSTATNTSTATSTPVSTIGPSPDCTVQTGTPAPSATSQVITLTYGDSSYPGDVTSVTDPNGYVTTYSYDAQGNLKSICDPLGNETSYGYDSVGRATSEVSPKGNAAGGGPAANYTTVYGYNAFDQVTSVTDPLLHVTQYTYDPNGNLQTVTDPLRQVTTYGYDADNQQTSVTEPDTTTVLKTDYDADGNVATQWDGLNQPTTYSYDALNRVTSVTDPKNRLTTYAYDGAGELTSTTDAMNRTASYGYNAVGEVTSVTYSDGTTPNVTGIGYSPDGLQTSMTDGTGTSTYSYDALDRLKSSTNGAGQSVGYGYDMASNLTSITYPDTSQVVRGYDADGRLKSITDWANNTTGFGYDVNSNLATETYPNSTAATYSYDATDTLTGITDTRGATPIWTFGYTPDANSRVGTANDPLDGSQHTYTYDPLSRLKADTTGSSTASWTYDAGDSLKTVADSATNSSSTLGYDVAHQLSTLQTTVNGTTTHNVSYSYNANGDRIGAQDSVTSTSTTYGYNQNDQLTSFTNSAGTATYSYDGSGLRTSKTVSRTSEGFVWNLAEGLPTIIQDGSTKYVTGPGGLPLEQVSSTGTVLYYYQDQLGSTRGLLDSSGTTAATYSYDAYGNLKSSTGSVSNPFQYAGQYTDSESGLQYLRARYYDPSTEQFLTVDPLVGLTGEPYSFTGGNPVNAFDPSGLDFWSSTRKAVGQLRENAGTLVPVAIYAVAVAGVVTCAYVTLGICVAADVATGGLLFAGGNLILRTLSSPGEGTLQDDSATGGDTEACTANPDETGAPDIGALLASGSSAYSKALTRAGHSYQKHMARGDLPRVPGRELNQAGQALLASILANPGTTRSTVSKGQAAGGVRFIDPEGIGAVFNADGQFRYFGKFTRP